MIGNLITVGAISLGGGSWTGTLTTGATATVGVGSTVIGNLIAFGVITVAANVETCDLTSTMGPITLGADAKTGAITTSGAGPSPSLWAQALKVAI
jgi:hypothetical protein